jgi:hypothetical protein
MKRNLLLLDIYWTPIRVGVLYHNPSIIMLAKHLIIFMIAVIAVIINGLLKLTEPVAVLLNNKLLCNPFPKSRRGVFYDFIGLVQ